MVDNFIRELKNINATDIMGIYGSAHTGLNSMDNSGVVPCMANQLKKIYGNYIHSEDLSYMAKEIDPIRIDNIEIGNKNYVAYYYGKQDLRGFKDFEYREFWRIENAYSDLRNKAKTGDVLPYDNYPMGIEKGQVFVITLMKRDGSESRMFFRADGNKWEGKPVTENIEITK
jgi:hypothetical protein